MSTPVLSRSFLTGILSLGLMCGVGLAPGLVAAADVADALFEQANQSDWVQVKVDLAAPAHTDQVEAIDQTADDLLSALPPGSYQAVTRDAGSTSLTLQVDAAALAALSAAPEVASIGPAAMPAAMQRLAAGTYHSHAIEPDGSLWSWGYNYYGQLGDGARLDRWTRGQVLSDVASVATGGDYGNDHTLAVKTDGSLWTWGYNGYGQLGTGTTQDRWTPASIRSGVTAVAAGANHSLAVTSDTGLWAWGYNGSGQLGDGSTTGKTSPKLIVYNVADVAAGGYHTLALKTDGSLYAWGRNVEGELGNGGTANSSTPAYLFDGVTAIAAGRYHSLALKTDGSLLAWGYNADGELGDGTTWNRTRPVQVLTGVIAMSAGRYHTLALKSDGSLWAWGYNSNGQIGDNSLTTRTSPVKVLTDVAAVSAGGYHSIARKTDGSLWAWGYNDYGQLGDGTTTDRLLPVPVQGFTPALPTAPSTLAADAVSSSQINLTWRDNSSNEQGFRIERQEGSGGWSQIATTGPDVTSFANTALNSGTTYSYRIVAYNAAGNSGYSNTATATTLPTLPTAPTNLAAVAVSTAQINLNWADNSSNEQGFRIERQTGAAAWGLIATVGVNATGYSDTGLSPATTYSYRVLAYNASGDSAHSNTASATTSSGVCTAPAIPITVGATLNEALSTTDCISQERLGGHYRDNFVFAATAGTTYTIDLASSAFDTYAYLLMPTVGVIMQDDNGGGGTNSRIVYRAASTGNLRIQVTSYSPGVTGAYQVTLRTQSSPPTPAAPSALTAGATSTSRIVLGWNDNSTNERGFRIERRLGTAPWAQIAQVGANVRTFANIGLAAGTTYSYRVLAYNAAGVSAYSNAASATTQGGTVAKPAAPTSLVARAASNRQVNLTWRDNANNESGYRIERKIGTAAWVQIAEVPANTTSFANIGLTPNTTYTYRVRAFNAGGTSAYATSLAVKTPR